MKINCQRKICYHRENGECTLDEITIGEFGECIDGATSVYDEAVKLAKECGYESYHDLFKNIKLD